MPTTKKFTSTFELTISPENISLIPLIAQEFGWYPEMNIAPEEAIKQHFELFYLEGVKNRIHSRLLRLNGEAGKAEVEAIMAQYDSSVSSSTSFIDS